MPTHYRVVLRHWLWLSYCLSGWCLWWAYPITRALWIGQAELFMTFIFIAICHPVALLSFWTRTVTKLSSLYLSQADVDLCSQVVALSGQSLMACLLYLHQQIPRRTLLSLIPHVGESYHFSRKRARSQRHIKLLIAWYDSIARTGRTFPSDDFATAAAPVARLGHHVIEPITNGDSLGFSTLPIALCASYYIVLVLGPGSQTVRACCLFENIAHYCLACVQVLQSYGQPNAHRCTFHGCYIFLLLDIGIIHLLTAQPIVQVFLILVR